VKTDYLSTFGDTLNAEERAQKALKVISVLKDYAGNLSHLRVLEIGCSAGFQSKIFAQYVEQLTALDVDEKALDTAVRENKAHNIEFLLRDGMQTGLPDSSFDVVICSHVYEHVPDSTKLMQEIQRVLVPGGICYFAAGNRLALMEPHYRLPLLGVIPKPVAHWYLKVLGRGTHYYENHLTLIGLRRLVKGFTLTDYTRRIVETPEFFHATDQITPRSLKQNVAIHLARFAYGLFPTFIWVLKKR
jgi:2-polyprenyl-3-methyl-5-hydroxy-6-metoxy-1,4-benzoquinol methylase